MAALWPAHRARARWENIVCGVERIKYCQSKATDVVVAVKLLAELNGNSGFD